MSNGNHPAFPVINHDRVEFDGLTKREYLAATVLSGFAYHQWMPHADDMGMRTSVRRAIRYADLLLEELSK